MEKDLSAAFGAQKQGVKWDSDIVRENAGAFPEDTSGGQETPPVLTESLVYNML
jgi:hypothetical protein